MSGKYLFVIILGAAAGAVVATLALRAIGVSASGAVGGGVGGALGALLASQTMKRQGEGRGPSVGG
jgi:membrane associated rhomboid family serine protease